MLELKCIKELESFLPHVTPETIAVVEDGIQPPQIGERVLCTLPEDIRRWFALAAYLDSLEDQARFQVAHNLLSPDRKQQITNDITRYQVLQSFARELFWMEARFFAGDAAFITGESVGLRAGWLLVAAPDSVSNALHKLLGGMGISLFRLGDLRRHAVYADSEPGSGGGDVN